MRKFLISLLLASAVATPALAGPRDSSDRQQAREERQQAREERQAARAESRSERAAPARVERNDQPRQQFVARPQFSGGDRPQFNGGERPQPRVDVNAMRAQRESQRAAVRNDRVEQRQERVDQRQAARDLRQSTRPVPNVMRDRHPLVVSDTPRPGTQPPLRVENRRTPAVQWNTNWRDNNRYDWRNHRRHHRSLFHLGFYYDPFGWGYSPFQIGWRLWPAYYSNRYWINDPWQYRLPYAPPGYRWVRYWNDALLVDTWTGTVVDMIPGFFW
jgi:Ni/Co efflux regulator RcnB